MSLIEMLIVFALLALIVLYAVRSLRWRVLWKQYEAVCRDQQKTIYMQECELLEARVLKINQDHRAAKKAML